MIKTRAIQALLICSLIIGCFIGCREAREREQGEPLIKWMSNDELEQAAMEKQVKALKEAKAAEQKAREEKREEKREQMRQTELLRAFDDLTEVCLTIPDEVVKKTPPPPPPPVVQDEVEEPEEVWADAGPEVLSAMALVLGRMEQTTLGYRINDLVIGRVMDNMTNHQAGELAAIQRYLKLVSGQLPRSSQPAALARDKILRGDLEKWWFPSGETTLREGGLQIKALADSMKAGKVKIAGTPENLKNLLELTASMLAEEQEKLLADGIAWRSKDDVFYHARGTASACKEVISGADQSFKPAVKSRKAVSDLQEAVFWLDKAARMDPLMVLAGDADAVRANHLLTMAHALSRAEDALLEAGSRL